VAANAAPAMSDFRDMAILAGLKSDAERAPRMAAGGPGRLAD